MPWPAHPWQRGSGAGISIFLAFNLWTDQAVQAQCLQKFWPAHAYIGGLGLGIFDYLSADPHLKVCWAARTGNFNLEDTAHCRNPGIQQPTASVAPLTAMPTSARFRAGASFTPSPVIPTLYPSCRSVSTMRNLWSGNTYKHQHAERSAYHRNIGSQAVIPQPHHALLWPHLPT